MRRRATTLRFAALALGCAGVIAQGSAPEDWLAGQVIVKFAPGEPVERAITDALSAGASKSASIDRYVADISERLGVPLHAQRVTSGGELVIAVRVQELLERLAEDAVALPDVTGAVVSLDPTDNPFQRRDEVIISYARSSETYRLLLDADDASTLSDLLTPFREQTSWRLQGRILPEGQLAIGVDFHDLTAELARRLEALDEVAYAQPDFIVRPFE